MLTIRLKKRSVYRGFAQEYFKEDQCNKEIEKMPIETVHTFSERKIVEPLKGFLTQGLGSNELALSIAFGVTIGTMPVLGVTTILCGLVAIILRLNLPVIQFANYLVYPLQVVLLAPFYYFGNLFFGGRQDMRFDTLKDVLTGIPHKETITMLLESTLHAIGAWLLISPLILILLYAALKPALVRVQSRSSKRKFIRR